jgi:hypothetical protein
MSLYVIVYIGVASTETDILFCEKKLSSKKIVKNLKFNLKKKKLKLISNSNLIFLIFEIFNTV